MKRTLLGVAAVVILAAAVFILRRSPEPETHWSGGVATETGQYLNDSLGVGMLLPDAPGWSFRYAPEVPGGGVAMATHESQAASVRLYAHSRQDGATFVKVIEQRRDQLASIFQVSDLDEVIESVLRESTSEFHGFPAWQWGGVTEPVAVAGDDPKRVMLMLLVLERQDFIIDVVGLLAFSARPTAEQQQEMQNLVEQTTFVLDSFQVR